MTVYVLIHEGYADWELGYVLAELQSPPVAPEIPKNRREVVTFGLRGGGEPQRSMGGLAVTPQVGIDDIPVESVEALILPGGTFWGDLADERLDTLVRAVRGADKPIAAICAATGYLARLGLLEEVAHTSNGAAYLAEVAPDYGGAEHYQEALAVRAEGIITASGLAAVEFTHEVLSALEVYPAPVQEGWFRAFKYGELPPGL